MGELILYTLLGTIAGCCAGLFGLGGGMIIVPGLFFLFECDTTINHEVTMHFARNTAMAIMLLTSMVTVFNHNRQGNIKWGYAARALPGLAIGVASGHLLSTVLDTEILELIFSVFLMLVVIKKVIDNPLSSDVQEIHLNPFIHFLFGSVLGFKSGVLGVGGGAISVIFFNYIRLSLLESCATSAFLTFSIALFDNLINAVFYFDNLDINWEALLLIVPSIFFSVPLGVAIASRLPEKIFDNIFTFVIVLVSIILFCRALV